MNKKSTTIKEFKKLCGDPAKCDWFALISGVPFVPYTAKFFLSINMPANVITFLWGILGVIAAILYVFGDYKLNLLGLLLFHIAYLMDGIDGLVARFQDNCTIRGVYLDLVNHALIKPLLLLGMGIGAFINPPAYIPLQPYAYLIFGSLAAVFIVNNNLARLKVYETYADVRRIDLIEAMARARFKTVNVRSLKHTINVFFRIHPLGLFYWGTIFNFLPLVVIFYGVTLPLTFVARAGKEFLAIKKNIDIPELEARLKKKHLSRKLNVIP